MMLYVSKARTEILSSESWVSELWNELRNAALWARNLSASLDKLKWLNYLSCQWNKTLRASSPIWGQITPEDLYKKLKNPSQIHRAKVGVSPCGGHARQAMCTQGQGLQHPPENPEPQQSLASMQAARENMQHSQWSCMFLCKDEEQVLTHSVITSELPMVLVQTVFIYIACQKWQFLCKDEEQVLTHSQLNISFRKHQLWIAEVLKPYPNRNYMESSSLGAINNT